MYCLGDFVWVEERPAVVVGVSDVDLEICFIIDPDESIKISAESVQPFHEKESWFQEKIKLRQQNANFKELVFLKRIAEGSQTCPSAILDRGVIPNLSQLKNPSPSAPVVKRKRDEDVDMIKSNEIKTEENEHTLAARTELEETFRKWETREKYLLDIVEIRKSLCRSVQAMNEDLDTENISNFKDRLAKFRFSEMTKRALSIKLNPAARVAIISTMSALKRKQMHRETSVDVLVRDSAALTDLVMRTFLMEELHHLIPDNQLRMEFFSKWQNCLSDFRRESEDATGSFIKAPPPSQIRQESRSNVLQKLRSTEIVSKKLLEGLVVKNQTTNTLLKPALSYTTDKVIITEKEENINYRSDWTVNHDDLQRLANVVPVKIFGNRKLQGGKRKRGAAGQGSVGFDPKRGTYFNIISDGFLQFSNGMIEIFFKNAEILLTGFYD